LVSNKLSDNRSVVGVAFPEYDADKYSLGKKLRLFAKNETDLLNMQCEQSFKHMIDYIRLECIKPTPEQVNGYRCFKQVKPRGSKEKLARRRSKRKKEPLAEALSHFKAFEIEKINLPYIKIHSATTGQRFSLFIEKQDLEQPREGFYSCYGLSKAATVPSF